MQLDTWLPYQMSYCGIAVVPGQNALSFREMVLCACAKMSFQLWVCTALRLRFLWPTAQSVIALGSTHLELVAKQDGDTAYTCTHFGDQPAVFA